jgi:hypothetical protein
MNLVDFFAILPGYIEFFFGDAAGGLAILRVLRMARILRMVKIGSFEMYLGLVAESLKRSRVGLTLLLYLVILFMVITATFMYMIEGDPQVLFSQPFKFSSIPETFWCIIVTMSSVGYGDMFPTSDEGRIVGSFVMVSGILTLAVPITLIGNRFNDVWLDEKRRARKELMMEKLREGKHDHENYEKHMEELKEEELKKHGGGPTDKVLLAMGRRVIVPTSIGTCSITARTVYNYL